MQEEGEIAISQHELLKIVGVVPQGDLSTVAVGEAGVAFVLASATTLPGGPATVRSICLLQDKPWPHTLEKTERSECY